MPKIIKNRKPREDLKSQEIKKKISAILMFLIAIIFVLSFFNLAGVAGKIMMKFFNFLIGKVIFIFPLILILTGIILFKTQYKKILFHTILAILILILAISGILEGFNSEIKNGGWIGYIFSWPFLKLFGFWVTQIIFLALIIISGLIFWQLFTPHFFLRKAEEVKEKKESLITQVLKKLKNEPKFEIKEIEPEIKTSAKEISLELKTKPIELISDTKYQLPPLELLEIEKETPLAGDIRVNSAIIKKTLQNFNIPVEMSEINIGPTVTQYTLKPAEGIKLSKITTLSNDLALALASHPIRIEAPIPGRSLVGIEVPNKLRAQVRLRNLISSFQFQNNSFNLNIGLGRDVSGKPIFTDLTKMPHFLVAGSTGTGKTIFLNSLILSLLYRNSPEILRFILIDPKRVEFSVYNDLPHLLSPVIYDVNQTINILKWLIFEMERRFDLISEAKTRDIISYNQIATGNSKFESIPYIVLIIDELADLMAAKGREMEAGIVRIAQMARAVGIHLVLATQRPSVEVITGLIKANITARVTFQVASQVDSRTILDMAGAEKLLGSGDLLFVSAEVTKPKRIQAAYVSEKEVKKVVNWLKLKISPPLVSFNLSHPSLVENSLIKENLLFKETDQDPLYEEAKRVVIEAKKASASLLQRRLKIGYARAARLIDILEERGMVGPGEGSKPREVYIKIEENK